MRPWCLALLAAALSAQPDLPSARAGNYHVSLRLPADGLTAQEEMQIEYRVVDSSRVDPVMGPAPIIRAQARSVIEMPAMPAMAKLLENVHPEGVPGEYGLHPVFPHGGEYRLRLFVTPPGDREFEVQFPLQVGDAVHSKAHRPRRPGSSGRGTPPIPPGRSESVVRGSPEDRKAKPRPFYAEIRTTPKTPKAGEPVDLHIEIFSRINGKTRITEFDTQHERLIHLIVVRQDLGVFAHEHPSRQADGSFRLRYAFPEAGEYTLFADAAPKGAGAQVMPFPLRVAGKSNARFAIGAEKITGETASGSVRVTFAQTRVPTGKTLRLSCLIRDAQTNALVSDLQPYLGALGHLILVHEDGQTFVHSHPDELDPLAGHQGNLAFLARFPKPGRYRAWVQLQRAGVVETGPFTILAEEP